MNVFEFTAAAGSGDGERGAGVKLSTIIIIIIQIIYKLEIYSGAEPAADRAAGAGQVLLP